MIKTCIISGWLHLIIGFVLGWVVLKRPAWVQRFFDKIKDAVT